MMLRLVSCPCDASVAAEWESASGLAKLVADVVAVLCFGTTLLCAVRASSVAQSFSGERGPLSYQSHLSITRLTPVQLDRPVIRYKSPNSPLLERPSTTPQSSPKARGRTSSSQASFAFPLALLTYRPITSLAKPEQVYHKMSLPTEQRTRSGSLHSDEKEPIGYALQANTLTKDTGVSHDEEANQITEDIDSGFDAAEVKRVRRKIDMRLLPILGALYSIALIDRTNLSAARIAGAGKELKLTAGTNYSIPLLMFFIPYILLELPSNLLLRKVGAAKQLSLIAFCWGVVMIGQGFVRSWQTLTITRALIGAFEAGFFPACVWLISTWYVRRESQVRMSAFYLISVGVSGFSNILAYAMSLIKVADRTFMGWRWIFIIEGLLTVVLSVVAYWTILDFPDKAAEKGFLTIAERDMILTRIQRDRADAKPDALTWGKAIKYTKDIKVWLYGLMFMCTTMPTYGFAYFLPPILQGALGFSLRDSFLLGAAPYCVAMVGAFATAVVADRYYIRMPLLIGQCFLTIVGLGMLFATEQRNVQLAGCFLGVWGANANIPFVLNFSQNNVAGQSKKSFTSVIVIMFGGIGGIFASLAYNEKDAPLYRKGLYATIACQAFNVVCGIGFTLYFYSANKKIRAGRKVVDDRPGFTYTI